MRNAALALLTISLSGYLILHALALPGHIFDEAWSLHAKNHILRASMGGVALAIAGLFITWIPLRRGERWAQLALAVIWLLGFAGFWIASMAIEFGLAKEQTPAFILFGLMTLLGGAGLGMSAFSFRSKGTSETGE